MNHNHEEHEHDHDHSHEDHDHDHDHSHEEHDHDHDHSHEDHDHDHDHSHDEHSHDHGHSHGHGHSHFGHSHSHAAPSLASINRAFYIGIALNAAFTIIEFIIGYMANSLALIADASHNLSDVASLIISLIGLKLMQKAATKFYTYGYRKASILASLINACLLVYISINIIIEAIKRLTVAPEVVSTSIIITAIIGVFINSISAFLFFKGQKEDINIKGAFLHLMVDAVVSIGVVISGTIIHFTGWHIIDPIISFVIAIVILISTWNLLRESVKLSLDGVPQDINMENVKHILSRDELVEGFHHLHVWALSSSQNALTVHIRLKDDVTSVESFMEVKNRIKRDLKEEKINHSTIELDNSDADDCS